VLVVSIHISFQDLCLYIFVFTIALVSIVLYIQVNADKDVADLELASKISDLKIEMKKMQVKVPKVAFSVRHSESSGIGVVKYSVEVLDTMNSYDPNTGIFTVPFPGIYFFSWANLRAAGSRVGTFLQVDGAKASGWAYGDPMGDSGAAMVAGSLAVELGRGQEVAVYQESGELAIGGNDHHMFSGFLT